MGDPLETLRDTDLSRPPRRTDQGVGLAHDARLTVEAPALHQVELIA